MTEATPQLDPAAVEAAAKNIHQCNRSKATFWGPWDALGEMQTVFREEAHAAITAYIAAIEPQLRERVRAYGEAAMEYQATPEGADFLAALKVQAREHHLYALLGLEAE